MSQLEWLSFVLDVHADGSGVFFTVRPSHSPVFSSWLTESILIRIHSLPTITGYK